MTKNEEILIGVIKICCKDKNITAAFLQNYVANHGFLSDEAGNLVKEILEKADKNG